MTPVRGWGPRRGGGGPAHSPGPKTEGWSQGASDLIPHRAGNNLPPSHSITGSCPHPAGVLCPHPLPTASGEMPGCPGRLLAIGHCLCQVWVRVLTLPLICYVGLGRLSDVSELHVLSRNLRGSRLSTFCSPPRHYCWSVELCVQEGIDGELAG